jgi:tRNA A-37 threonylcarbamoyl transferase component Bud32
MIVETNSGIWLDRRLRVGACGTWWSGGSAGGQPLGMLRLEPELVAQPAARERVAAAVAAVRAANPPGVLRTTELVVDSRHAWLVVGTIPRPTLADVLAACPALPAGAAAGLAVDVGNALRQLHAVGLSHGDLAADTVIVTMAGAAALAEVGVLAAARDEPADVDQDCRAWAALALDLAATSDADLLVAAAAVAESGDLEGALRRLSAAAADLPEFASRDALTALMPTVGPAPDGRPARRAPAAASTMDITGTAVSARIQQAAPQPEVVKAAPATVAPRRRRRWISGIAVVVVMLLGAGAAVWWFVVR